MSISGHCVTCIKNYGGKKGKDYWFLVLYRHAGEDSSITQATITRIYMQTLKL